MSSKGFNRRQALGVGAAAVAGATMLPSAASAHSHGERLRAAEPLAPRQNIGIQLYSLRDLQAASVQNTIQQLANVGYPEVELFTMQGASVATWRGILDQTGVRAIAAHVGIDRWRSEPAVVIREAKQLGMQYVGLPGVFPQTQTRAAYRQLARDMNRWGEQAADAGLRFYYHNHNFEFARDGGTTGTRFYDILVNETNPDTVFFEMDLYWVVAGGVDPMDYLGVYDQSRWPLFHVKDRDAAGAFADLGEGNINFQRVFQALENKHYHHYLVERDTQVNPIRTAETGYEYLRDLEGRRRRRPYSPDEAAGRTTGARA